MKTPNLHPLLPFARHAIYMEVEDARNHVPALARLRNFLANRKLGCVLNPKFVEWIGDTDPLSEVLPCQSAPGHPSQMTVYFVQCTKVLNNHVLAAVHEFGFKVMPWQSAEGKKVIMVEGLPPRTAHLALVMDSLAPAALG
ncbi:hypothetical protein EPO17_01685 [Patescibacteria group bacterium]|nr:MAG: hypothetical protein EPO17_01685 [Patescibacteria group bacterium]